MGGRKKNNVVYFQPKPKRPPVTRVQAQPDPVKQLETMEPLHLVQGINNLLRTLEKKGVQISDYDHKERKLYSVQQVKGKFYYLAAEDTEEKR